MKYISLPWSFQIQFGPRDTRIPGAIIFDFLFFFRSIWLNLMRLCTSFRNATILYISLSFKFWCTFFDFPICVKYVAAVAVALQQAVTQFVYRIYSNSVTRTLCNLINKDKCNEQMPKKIKLIKCYEFWCMIVCVCFIIIIK